MVNFDRKFSERMKLRRRFVVKFLAFVVKRTSSGKDTWVDERPLSLAFHRRATLAAHVDSIAQGIPYTQIYDSRLFIHRWSKTLEPWNWMSGSTSMMGQ